MENNDKKSFNYINVPMVFVNDSVLYNTFSSLNSVNDQTKFLKSILEQSKHESKTIDFLTKVFLVSSSNHQVRKTVTRILFSKQNSLETVIIYVSENISKLLQEPKKTKHLLASAINACIDGFPNQTKLDYTCSMKIFSTMPEHLREYIAELSSNSGIVLKEILNELHCYSRAIIFVLVQTDFYINKNMILIFELIQQIIKIEIVPLETRCNFGIIFARYVQIFGPEAIHEILFKILDGVFRFYLNYTERWPNIQIKNQSEKLCIVFGLINVIELNSIVMARNGISENIFIILTTYLCELSQTSCKTVNSEQLLTICRELILLSKKANLQLTTNRFDFICALTKFVVLNLEHNIDTVRHSSKLILINIIKMITQQKIDDDIESELWIVLDILKTKIFHNLSIYYTCISILCLEAGCNTILKLDPSLIDSLFNDLFDDSIQIHQIHVTFINLMKKHSDEIDESGWQKIWLEPIIDKILTQNSNQYWKENLNLFMEAVAIKPKLSVLIIKKYKYDCIRHPALLLCCAKVARQYGISKNSPVSSFEWKGIIDTRILENSFKHNSFEIRLAALSVLAESKKSTETFDDCDFILFFSFLKNNLNSQLPSVRQQILGSCKKIFNRIKDSYVILKRTKENCEQKLILNGKPVLTASVSVEIAELEEKLQIVNQKLNKYLQSVENIIHLLLVENLLPGVNYARRTLILELYTLLETILEDMFTKRYWSEEHSLGLFWCLTDSYEQNKKLALNVLKQFRPELIGFKDYHEITATVRTCEVLMYSKHPSDCITAAYLLDLCLNSTNKIVIQVLHNLTGLTEENCIFYLAIRLILTYLNQQFTIAKKNIIKASAQGPMYSCLFVIRYLYLQTMNRRVKLNKHWQNLINDIVNICFEISEIVTPIVNNQSPEGYYPNDYKEMCQKLTVTPQMILLCAWRCIKEISLLFGDIISHIELDDCRKQFLTDIEEPINVVLSYDQVTQVGNYFIDILMETKHRGAFEQAYVGFTKFCKRLWREKSVKLSQLPEMWLQDILASIVDKNASKTKNLCATRRSAGLPFMVQAILGTCVETLDNTELFKMSMQTLLRIADEEREKQNSDACTHAMNILRALYRHSQLNEHCIQFIASGVIVALCGINGKTWAIRNSATLLFATLMTRIFGVQRNKDTEKISTRNRLTANVFFSHFPTLYHFLYDELKTASDSNTNFHLALYPILLLLARLYLPIFNNGSNENTYDISIFVPLLNECSKNQISKTRELAAKALIPLLEKNSIDSYFKKLISNFKNCQQISNNYRHGILLQILEFLKQQESDTEILDEIWYSILSLKWRLLNESNIIKSIYCKILLNLINQSNLNAERVLFLKEVLEILKISTDSIKMNAGSENFEYSLIQLKYNIQKIYPVDLIQNNIKNIFVETFLNTKYSLVFLYNLECITALVFRNNAPYLLKNKNNDFKFLNKFTNIKEEQLKKDLLTDTLFFNSFKHQLINNNDDKCRAKLYLLLNLFVDKVCDLYDLNENDSLNYLIELCYSECESIVPYCLNCINNLLKSFINNNVLLNSNVLNKLYDCLYNNCLVEVDYNIRKVVAEIIVENSQLHENNWLFCKEINLCKIWLTIQLLANDVSENIRQTIVKIVVFPSESVTFYPTIETVKEDIFAASINELKCISLDLCTAFLLYWIIRDNVIEDNFGEENEEEACVFDKGDLNTYIEDVYLAQFAIKHLQTIFTEMNFIKRNEKCVYLKKVLESKDLINWYPENGINGKTILLSKLDDVKTDCTVLKNDLFNRDLLLLKIKTLLLKM